MKKKNVLMMAMSLVLVAVIAVGGTLAYLTSNSGTLTNTFTVGQGYGEGGFYLDETKMNGTTNPTEPGVGAENRIKAPGTNNYAAMSVGDSIYKDPTFHLTSGPESFVFAKVSGVDSLVEKGFTVTGWDTSKWVPISGQADGKYDGYYRFYKTVVANEEMAPLFTNVTLPSTVTSMPDITGINTITIEGVAVQSDNLDESSAWTEADKHI